MCGRARCTLRVEDVGRAAGFRNPLRSVDADRYRPSYNVVPGRHMPVVRHMQAGEATEQGSSEPVVHCMKWGLIPSYTKRNEKPDHYRMFNARSESVHLKSTFSRLLKKNRCVATVEGFYEWKKDGSKKQPYYLHFKDERPLVFAALYDSWKDEEGNVLNTFTILTTRNSKAIDWLHDRMPVILPNEAAVSSWLKDELTEASLHKLTLPYEASDLVWYPVTPEMGKPSFDVPECIKEIKPKLAKESSIFQLFGKKKNMGRSSQDGKELSSQVSETTEHQASGEGCPASTMVNEWDLESEEDKKALLAGLEPDQDVTHALHEKMNDMRGPLEDSNLQNSDPARDVAVKGEVRDEDFAVKKEPAKEGSADKDEAYEKDFAVKEEAHEKDFTVKQEIHEEYSAADEAVGENDIAVKGVVHEKGLKDQKRTFSPVKETARLEPEAKKRNVSVSPRDSKKTPGKGAAKATLPNKQRSLHSFFGKK